MAIDQHMHTEIEHGSAVLTPVVAAKTILAMPKDLEGLALKHASGAIGATFHYMGNGQPTHTECRIQTNQGIFKGKVYGIDESSMAQAYAKAIIQHYLYGNGEQLFGV